MKPFRQIREAGEITAREQVPRAHAGKREHPPVGDKSPVKPFPGVKCGARVLFLLAAQAWIRQGCCRGGDLDDVR